MGGSGAVSGKNTVSWFPQHLGLVHQVRRNRWTEVQKLNLSAFSLSVRSLHNPKLLLKSQHCGTEPDVKAYSRDNLSSVVDRAVVACF